VKLSRIRYSLSLAYFRVNIAMVIMEDILIADSTMTRIRLICNVMFFNTNEDNETREVSASSRMPMG